jgi:hypothetical protein
MPHFSFFKYLQKKNRDFFGKAYFPEEKTLNIVQKENQRRLEAGRI